jgi:transposase InsO family protein
VSHAAVYYQATPISERDLALMRLIDEIYLEQPHGGTRGILRMLRNHEGAKRWLEAQRLGRKHVATRRVLAHKPCTTLEAHHAVEIVEQTIARFGTPGIDNTDQGSQFTALEFTDAIKTRGIKLSMDGKGAWRDNVFVERFWRTVKYERIYKRAYGTVSEARADIAEYVAWYNDKRPHTSLDDRTPKRAYDESRARQAATTMKVAA